LTKIVDPFGTTVCQRTTKRRFQQFENRTPKYKTKFSNLKLYI